MSPFRPQAAGVLSYLVAFQMRSTPAAAPNLDSLRWRKRVLLVFADREADGRLEKQNEVAQTHSAGFAERDIEVFRLIGDGPEARSLRDRCGVAGKPFVVVLIGKDGSVKFRKGEPAGAAELFEIIDRMPMRREELERRK